MSDELLKAPSPRSRNVAGISFSFAFGSALCLLALHFLSPELDPSWHMVSEYAYGSHGGVLSAFFFCWGLASITSSVALFPLGTRWWHSLGAVLVLLSGVGAIAGGLFDVRHPLHGLAFALGVPTLPIGALLLSGHVAKYAPTFRTALRISAHITWLSIIAMGAAMALFISSLQAAGAFHPESHQVLEALPAGVTSIVGYANRFLVLAYLTWLSLAGLAIRSTRTR